MHSLVETSGIVDITPVKLNRCFRSQNLYLYYGYCKGSYTLADSRLRNCPLYLISVIRKQRRGLDEAIANAGRTNTDGGAGVLILALILCNEAERCFRSNQTSFESRADAHCIIDQCQSYVDELITSIYRATKESIELARREHVCKQAARPQSRAASALTLSINQPWTRLLIAR